MNPYLIGLALYGFAIARLSVTFRASVGLTTSVWLRWSLGGVALPQRGFSVSSRRTKLYLRRQGPSPAEEKEVDPVALLTASPALRAALLSPRLWRACFQELEWRALALRVRVAFQNAAHTALAYAALHAAFQTLSRCAPLPPGAELRVSADFDGRGAHAEIAGIVSIRLGNLVRIACVAASLWLRARKEETLDAASD